MLSLSFGKYRNRDINLVPIGYLEWLHREGKNLPQDVIRMISSRLSLGRGRDYSMEHNGSTAEIEIGHMAKIKHCPYELRQLIYKNFSRENPKWFENEKHGRWNGRTPKTLHFWEESEDGAILFPRGDILGFINQAEKSGINVSVTSEFLTFLKSKLKIEFRGTLKPFQARAVDVMAQHQTGVLQAPTGAGKTVMALALVSRIGQPFCVIVHTVELLQQWRDKIINFSGIPADDIGILGGGKKTIGSIATVAMAQTMSRTILAHQGKWGVVIVDEAHHTPATTFTHILKNVDAKFVFGLTATPYRRDGLDDVIRYFVGPVRHSIDPETLIASRDIVRPVVIRRDTDFWSVIDGSNNYSALMKELTEDNERNNDIAADVIREASGGRLCLVLTDRKAHCHKLADIITGAGCNTAILTGAVGGKKRIEIISDLTDQKIRVLVATGQLIGEGFDLPKISDVFLATPIRFSGRLLQFIGRAMRPAPGKITCHIWDYCDNQIPILKASFHARQREVYDNFEPIYPNF